MKVALYARVSKADDSQDPENQLAQLRAYAKERGWVVPEIKDGKGGQYPAEYVDMVSGAEANRPQLTKMLADARARRFSLVLCVKVDRLARSVTNLYSILSELDARSVKFECADQAISTNTPTGKLLLSMLAGVAEFERELIRDRTKAGLVRARVRGKRLGRPCVHVDLERARELKAKGLGYRKVAEALGVSHQTLFLRMKKEGVDGSKEPR